MQKLQSNSHAKYMQDIYNSHGIYKFVVFKQTTDEEHRLELEQKYYDYFARHNYILVNAIVPKQCTENYMFAGLAHHRQLLSKAQQRRYAKSYEHDKIAKRTYEQMQSEHVRSKISESCKRAHSSVKYAEMYANPQRGLSISTGLKQTALFKKTYGTCKVYKYYDNIGDFKPYMHFIVQPNNNVIAFVWDTRQVVFQCDAADLPQGYVQVRHDSKQLLNFS